MLSQTPRSTRDLLDYTDAQLQSLLENGSPLWQHHAKVALVWREKQAQRKAPVYACAKCQDRKIVHRSDIDMDVTCECAK